MNAVATHPLPPLHYPPLADPQWPRSPRHWFRYRWNLSGCLCVCWCVCVSVWCRAAPLSNIASNLRPTLASTAFHPIRPSVTIVTALKSANQRTHHRRCRVRRSFLIQAGSASCMGENAKWLPVVICVCAAEVESAVGGNGDASGRRCECESVRVSRGQKSRNKSHPVRHGQKSSNARPALSPIVISFPLFIGVIWKNSHACVCTCERCSPHLWGLRATGRPRHS